MGDESTERVGYCPSVPVDGQFRFGQATTVGARHRFGLPKGLLNVAVHPRTDCRQSF